ncbi:MAG: hypothetical protein ACJ780_24740 [Solirubrobacteraceae bacterium]
MFLPICEAIRVVESQPVNQEAHNAIVHLGFEGTVMKRRRSLYRPGRQAAWLKHKARHTAAGTLVEIREDRDGRPWAFCEVDRRRCVAAGNGVAPDHAGLSVVVTYSRVDADGGLREGRVTSVDAVPAAADS